MSARIVITTFGSSGDVHPYIGLSLALKARGHSPTLATSEYYRAKIERAGIAFQPVRPIFDPTDPNVVAPIMDPVRGGEFLICDIAMPSLRESYTDLRAIAKDADLLVTHPLTFAGRIVAEELGIPWVSSVLAPMSFFSAHDMPVFAAAPHVHAARHLGLAATRSIIRMAKLASRHWADPVRALRAELGLPSAPDPIFEGQHSPHAVLALFSRVLADPQPDWPPHTHITGSVFYDGVTSPSALPRQLEQFLAQGSPPIVFTLGTSAVGAAGRFYEQSAAAAQQLGARAVLLVGHDARNRPSAPLPDSMLVCDYAPYSVIFPRAAAIVHQGGVGTTAQALRAGKPMIVVPYAHDQPDNAFRVERLGVARVLYPKSYRTARVVETLSQILADSGIAATAAAVADRVRAEDGPAAASAQIESVLRHAPRVDSRARP
jgi:UDP:flavonoid glycosyltransferase YjiC (YdhE family)